MKERSLGRTWIVLCVAVWMAAASLSAQAAGPESQVSVEIQAQPLDRALLELSKQASFQLVVDSGIITAKRSTALSGTMSIREALDRLLRETNLSYRWSGEHTVTIIPRSGFTAAGSPGADAHEMLGASDGALMAQTPSAAGEVTTATEAPQPASDIAAGDKLEEIIVTAQKRSEDLQSVPVSVQVISSQLIREQNQNSFTDLSRTVPSLHVATDAKSNSLYIRGIGSGGDDPGFDQAVAMFSDDIYHGRSRMSDATFLDLDHIEILKGPQSTFFGNNAIAGALNIITKKPGDSFQGDVRVLAGMFEQYALEAAAGGPITDTFGARLAVTANGNERGWLDNVNTRDHIPRIHNLAGRLTLVYKPVDDLDATLKFEGAHHKTEGAAFDEPLQWTSCPRAPFPSSYGGLGACSIVLAQGLPQGLSNNNVSLLAGEGQNLTNEEGILTLNYRHWGQTFTSITGFSHYDFFLNANDSVLPVPYLQVQWKENYHQFSQELRVTSPSDQPIEYLAGAYFQTDRLNYDQINTFSFLNSIFASFFPNQYLPIAYRQGIAQNEDIYSAFGSATWNVSEQLKLSAGLRASRVNKYYGAHVFFGSSPDLYGNFVADPLTVQQLVQTLFGGTGSLGTSPALSRASQALMPSARIQYEFNPGMMAYFRYDRGFLAGGFNGSDVFNFGSVSEFGPEHVDAYELGLKSKWFDDRVLLNLDVFLSDYTDLQVSTLVAAKSNIGSGFVNHVANAGKSRSEGAELEGQWAVTRDVRLGANITYLDARFTSYPNASPNTVQSYCATPVATSGGAGTAYCLEQFPTGAPLINDLSGQRTPFAPTWSGSVTAAYGLPLPRDLKLTTELDPYFTSRYYTVSGDPLFTVGGYVRLDARMTLAPSGGRWAVDLIGKNLTNRTIIVSQPTFDNFSKEQPSNVAAQFRYNW